jgi:hypothetical protein
MVVDGPTNGAGSLPVVLRMVETKEEKFCEEALGLGLVVLPLVLLVLALADELLVVEVLSPGVVDRRSP